MSYRVGDMEGLNVVYKHTAPNGKVYIGITCQKPELRWNNGRGYANNMHFTNAINKYGWDNFKHEIVASSLTRSEAAKIEIELIKEYKSSVFEYGYNQSTGGENSRIGTKHSEETRRKISLAHKGQVNAGAVEAGRKLGKANKGRKASDETRRKLSEAHKNISEETRKKLSEAHKGAAQSDISKEKKRHCGTRAVTQYSKDGEKINIYYSTREAERQTKIDASHISKCCRGIKKTAGGFVWRYVSDSA